MELKMTKRSRGRKPITIKVTDCDGNFKIFESALLTAKYINCTVQTIYNCLHNKTAIRGCYLEKIK